MRTKAFDIEDLKTGLARFAHDIRQVNQIAAREYLSLQLLQGSQYSLPGPEAPIVFGRPPTVPVLSRGASWATSSGVGRAVAESSCNGNSGPALFN